MLELFKLSTRFSKHTPVRGTHVFPARFLSRNPRKLNEVIIANNSGIFFTLASLKMHAPAEHSKLTIITPKFWLDHTHDDYDNLHWGQAPYGLPWYVRREFYKANSGHKEYDPITWKQFKEFRKFVLDQIKQWPGVKIHTGIPKITKYQNNYHIVTDECAFDCPLDTRFYYTFREPDVKHEYAGLPQISHTELYFHPKNSAPPTAILVGGNLSVFWAAKHFPDTTFAYISRSENLQLQIHKLPNAIHYDTADIKNGSLEVRPSLYNPKGGLIIAKNGSRNFEGNFYSAIGLKPNLEIIKPLRNQNLISYPYLNQYSWTSPLIGFPAKHRGKIEKENEFRTFPIGSLMEATLIWAHVTGNLHWAYETHCYHEELFVDHFTNIMRQEGILVPETFFDKLREKTLSMPPPSPDASLLDNTVRLYKESYNKACQDQASPIVLSKLEQLLRSCEKTRAEEYKQRNGTSLQSKRGH